MSLPLHRYLDAIRSDRRLNILRKNGTTTAQQGPEYFRQIAAMRQAGGRPRSNPSEGPNPGEVAR